jgi:hypothetical protein
MIAIRFRFSPDGSAERASEAPTSPAPTDPKNTRLLSMMSFLPIE